VIVDDPGKSHPLVPTDIVGDGPVGAARFPRGVATEIGTSHALNDVSSFCQIGCR